MTVLAPVFNIFVLNSEKSDSLNIDVAKYEVTTCQNILKENNFRG